MIAEEAGGRLPLPLSTQDHAPPPRLPRDQADECAGVIGRPPLAPPASERMERHEPFLQRSAQFRQPRFETPAGVRREVKLRLIPVGLHAESFDHLRPPPDERQVFRNLKRLRQKKREAALRPARPNGRTRKIGQDRNVGIVAVEDDRPVGLDGTELAHEGANPPELSWIDDQMIQVRIVAEEIRAPPVRDGRDPRGGKGLPKRADRRRVHERVADRSCGEDKDSPDTGDIRGGKGAPIEPPDNPENDRKKKRDDLAKQVRRSLST